MTRQNYTENVEKIYFPPTDPEARRIWDALPKGKRSEIARLLFVAWRGETEQIRARAQAQLDAMDV